MPKSNKYECNMDGCFRPGRGARRRARRWAVRNISMFALVTNRRGHSEYSAVLHPHGFGQSFWIHGCAAGSDGLRVDHRWRLQ